MPELPEVETVRRGLAPVLTGRRLTRVTVRRPDLRHPLPPDLAACLTGGRVVRLDRRAKYLLMRTEAGPTLLWHLGMSGRVRVDTDDAPLGPHDHVTMETEAGDRVVFTDARRFGSMDLIRTGDGADHPRLAALGPEPLDPGFDGAVLGARLAGRRSPLKTCLLDQRVVAGLGNIYVCEALYAAGLAPGRRADSLAADALTRLAESIRTVLTAAVVAGGTTLRDHRTPEGEMGYFQLQTRVYGRAGVPCGPRCPPGCPGVQRISLGGRGTFYCPVHQE